MDLTSSLKGEHAVKKAHLLYTNPSFHSARGTTSLALIPYCLHHLSCLFPTFET